jgi:hypothetical protein
MAQFETLLYKGIEMSHIFEQDTLSVVDLKEKELKKLSRGAICYNETYPVSELFITSQDMAGKNSMSLILNRIPFELIPFTNENKFPKVIKKSCAEMGRIFKNR